MSARRMRVSKVCGADIELGNFHLGLNGVTQTGYAASRALLREIDAPYARDDEYGFGVAGNALRSSSGRVASVQDWGRKYLSSNGGCVYIDLDHLECCLPEVISAYDHVAAWHAMLRIARRALDAANAKLPTGVAIQVLANNSDGQGNSYGSHLNFLINRRAYDNIFDRKLHHLLYLAAYQCSSIVISGQGKVGAENGRPAAAYQIAQRADFMETLVGQQTTYKRPIVNSRDEPLCGDTTSRSGTVAARPQGDLARLHCIFFDNTLCHGSSLLKVGVTQIILAMLEAEVMNPSLILDDPVDAVVRWSHDPTLRARVPMASGQALTAVEVQLLFLEDAQRFVASGGCDGSVPRATEIMALWEDTLVKLKAEDITSLATRLDWVLKFRILQRALQQHPELTWASPEIKHLDHLYSSLDLEQGLYWVYEKLGLVEALVPESRVAYFVHEPPEDTRAWTRAMLLRIADPKMVHDVDWDRVRFRKTEHGYWPAYSTVDLANPLGFTKAVTEPIIQAAATFDDILDELHALGTNVDATLRRTDPQHNQTVRTTPRHASQAPDASSGNGHAMRNGWDDC